MTFALLSALETQVSSVDTPFMKAARSVQSAFSALTHKVAPNPGPAAMPTDTGAKPTAAQLNDAKLKLPGTVDMARATADAQKTLASIDFSKPDIVLWVPATGSHSIPAQWQAGVDKQWPNGGASSALVDYPASVDFNDSVSTGAETLRQVLAGIAAHGGDHKVVVGGHSQGAWVIGQSMSDPAIHHAIDAAAIYGHPAVDRAAHATSTDPKIHETNDPDDPFTEPMSGGREALAGIANIQHGDSFAKNALKLGPALLANPFLGAYLIGRTFLKHDYSGEADPHHYEPQYGDGAAFLKQQADPPAA